MAFSLFTSVSSSSRFSLICGVMLSVSSGASYTVSRAGLDTVVSNDSPVTRSMRPGLRPNSRQISSPGRSLWWMRTSCPLRFDRYTSSLGTARPDDCSSSARNFPRSELPGM